MRLALFLIAVLVLAAPAAHALDVRVHRGGSLVLAAQDYFRPPPAENIPDGALPDTEITKGKGHIRRAWLTEPTDRYGHGVLGDAIEAGGVAAQLEDGTTVRLSLDTFSVFEDRKARLADMDGDGRDEILIVRAYLNAGGALALVRAGKDQLEIAAMAPPIGTPNRWLNPAGAADFDGDGRMEAAVVITPHIGGTLQLYEWKGDRLVADHAKYGFSNHAIGSPNLDLSAVTDVDADGVPDLVLPDAARRYLIGVSFAGGTYKELFRHRLQGELQGAVQAVDLIGNDRDEILYKTHRGVAVLSFRP